MKWTFVNIDHKNGIKTLTLILIKKKKLLKRITIVFKYDHKSTTVVRNQINVSTNVFINLMQSKVYLYRSGNS